MHCSLYESSDWAFVVMEGPPDSDVTSYVYDLKTGALVEVDVSSMTKDACVARRPPSTPCAGTQSFDECDCSYQAWFCQSADGGAIGIDPCDAGAD